MPKVPMPDFAGMLAEANHGRSNQAMTERYGAVVVALTDKASEWGTEWKGTVTLTIKITADKYGGVDHKFKMTSTVEDEPLPGAKMYYNPDNGGLTTEEPRQIKMPGIDDEPRRVKSAAAPTRKEE